MLEILFSTNAANNLLASAPSLDDPGQTAGEDNNSYENLRTQWEHRVIMDVVPDNVFVFALALSFGDISTEDRMPALRTLCSFEDSDPVEHARRHWEQSQANLKQVLRRIAGGETARLFYSSNADEACGLCWFLSHLQRWLPECSVTLVPLLPHLRPRDAALCCYSWADVPPQQWGRYTAECQRKSSATLLLSAAQKWKSLQQENLPLRAVLGGSIHSVPADFYDCFLRMEMERLDEEFRESELIDRVMKHALGITPGFVSYRIQEMVAQGDITVVQAVKHGESMHSRLLHKSSWASPAPQDAPAFDLNDFF